MLFCFCPPIHLVCLNNEVVVFRSRTGTAPNLGSVADYNFYSNYPAPPVSADFLGIFIFPLYLTSLPSVAFVVVAPLSCTHYPPPSGAKRHPHGSCLHPPPVILHRSSMPLCAACLRLPPFSLTVSLPLIPHRLDPRSLSSPGGFACCGSLRASVPLPCHP